MIQWVLFGGQVLVVVLLYFFVWRVMAGARRELEVLEHGTAPGGGSQDSTIISAADAARARREAGLAEPRIVVVSSERLRAGVPYVIGNGLTIGRATDNDIVLDDQVVSSHHARIAPPDLLVDLESTNGTVVNGSPVRGNLRMSVGDTVQVGATTFRFEVES
jgi:hypothetical protein